MEEKEGLICLYHCPNEMFFDLLKNKGLNLEDCCACDGQGLDPLCNHRYIVPEKLKNYKLQEQRYLYNHFNVFIPVTP